MKVARLALFAAGVALAAGLAWSALRIGTVDRALHEASGLLAPATPAQGAPGAEAIARAGGIVQSIAPRAQGNPGVLELRGALTILGYDATRDLENAFADFGAALALRPTSPYTWANVAELKYRKGEVDAVFQAALRRAAELGPAEPEVQRTVANYGLATWEELSAETRRAVERTLKAAAARNPAELLQLAQRRGRLDVACRQRALGADPKWSQLCPSMEANS